MELKTTVSRHYRSIQNQLNGLRNQIVEEVLLYLNVYRENIGPAEFYVTNCTFASSEKPFCAIRLVGINDISLSGREKAIAIEKLSVIYKKLLSRCGHNFQLSILLDCNISRDTHPNPAISQKIFTSL